MSVFQTRFSSLAEFVSRNALWYPNRDAVVFEDERLTWKNLNERANRLANSLICAGIGKGDKAAVLSPNCFEYLEIMIGILKAGAVLVPISTMLKRETILLELLDAKPKVLFVAHSCLYLLEDCLAEFPDLPPGMRIMISGCEKGWESYTNFLQAGSAAEPRIAIAAEDLYNIVYSSGTTGAPKGIVHTHHARLLFALSCGLEFRIHNETVSLISTPIYTNGTQLIFLPTILMGGTVVIMSSFDPCIFLQLIQVEKCTHAFMVPTQFIRVMAHPQFGLYDTSSIEMLLSAAAPLRKKTKIDILQKFPKSRLAELYGLTEGISTVLRPNEQFAKLGSVGKPRLGGDIKIINEAGKEVSRGEVGEIIGYNFSMMREYYRNPEKTEEIMWNDEAGRQYIRTGDIGRLDEDGYLYILDRKKDMIISGGINIFPRDIEEIILRHPEVEEVAVIGIPHEEWGECPIALVVKKDPDSSLKESQLREWANWRLVKYQKLTAVEFRHSLPKNDLGKVLKNELRKPFWKESEA